jgi:hypothetical protein
MTAFHPSSRKLRNPLFGMYALLAATLGCLGTAAGGLAYAGDRSLAVKFANAVNSCELRFPISGFASPNLPSYDRCEDAAYRTEAWLVLAATIAVPLIAAGLVFVLPWLDGRRLARAGRLAETTDIAAGAEKSFGLLCDQLGMTGRRRPRLVVAKAGQNKRREAFTIGRPSGRPVVVIPPGTAIAYRSLQGFAPSVLHELAHVRVRDVSWVSVVRGLAWVIVPVLALASVPALLGGGSLAVERTFLVQAVVFLVCVLLLRAALLRQRETHADRQAMEWLGSPAPMVRFLSSGRAAADRGLTALPTSLLARHPSPAARIAALDDPVGVRDSGFAYALATGAIAAMVINTAYFIAWTFDVSYADQLPLRVAAVAGGLVLGLALGPELLGRAVRAREAGMSPPWWQYAAGTGLGLFLGSFVPPGTILGTTVSFFFDRNPTGVFVAVLLAVAGAGIVVLTAGLASLASPIRQWWVTPLVTVTMTCCAACVLFPLPDFGFSEAERLYLVFVLPDDQWRWLAVAYPAAVLILTVTTHGFFHFSRCLREVVPPVLVAGISTAIFYPHYRGIVNASPETVQRLVEEQWWVAVFGGLAVLVVLSLRRGVAGVARACVSAWLATLLTGFGLAVCGTFTYGWDYFRLLPLMLTSPSVWLFYLALVVSIVALIRVDAPAGVSWVWINPVAAGLVAVIVTVAVVTTGIPRLFVPRVSVEAKHSTPVASPPRAPGEVLTSAAASTVVKEIGDTLPGNWSGISTASTPAGHTTVKPKACVPFVNEEYDDQLPHRLIQDTGQFKMDPGTIEGTETLEVFVSSYASPVPAAFFAAADKDISSCSSFTDTEPGTTAHGAVRGIPVQGLSFPAVEFEILIRTRTASTALTWVDIGVGHNLIVLNQVTELVGSLAQPDQSVLQAAERAATGA